MMGIRWVFITAIWISGKSLLFGQTLAREYDRWIAPYIREGIFDYEDALEARENILALKNSIADASIRQMDYDTQKAFYINAYNILVITDILEAYPLRSVQDIERFFTNNRHIIGGTKLSLDDIEKSLLNPHEDPRIHMVLVCGAMSCPPLPTRGFTGTSLDAQLDEATKTALANTSILSINKEGAVLSQIFRWNIHDFEDLDAFILNYRPDLTGNLSRKRYSEYNWILNDFKLLGMPTDTRRDVRYFISYLYGKGQFELSAFNNYFSELRVDDTRHNFFTSFFRYTMGYSKRVNFIFELKFRSVSFGESSHVGLWESLRFGNEGPREENGSQVSFRKTGFSALIPRIKYQPFANIPYLSIQHAISIPLNYGSNSALDWGGPGMYHDIFYDKSLGSRSSVFLQFSVWLENIGSSFFRKADGYYQFSLPFTVIYQYFPSRKTTAYVLANVAPQWGYSVTDQGSRVQSIEDGYQQLGVGVKQYLSESTQLELLYTQFFPSREGSEASTFNVGFRYFGW